jgi:hypothetical protein
LIAIAALTELSTMNQPTSTGTKTSVTVSPRMSGQRTKEPTQKRTTTPQVVSSPQTNINSRIDPQIPVNPRLAHHRGTRGLSSTVSLESFNSTNNIKNNTINNNNNTNNNITGSPITNPSINGGSITNSKDDDTTINIVDQPLQRTLRTRATEKKQRHKLNTTVYRIF